MNQGRKKRDQASNHTMAKWKLGSFPKQQEPYPTRVLLAQWARAGCDRPIHLTASYRDFAQFGLQEPKFNRKKPVV